MYTIIDKESETKGKVLLPVIQQKPEIKEVGANILSGSILSVVGASQCVPPFFSIGFKPIDWNILPSFASHMTLNAYVVTLTGIASEWNLEVQQDSEDLYDNLLNEEYTEINVNTDIREKSEEYFETLLVVKYKYIPEVKAIYIDEYLDEKNITILLSVQQYDDKLMETLIQKEIDISKLFPDIIADYNYLPNLIDDKKSIVGEKTKLIFER